jgi:hypothetical protein
MSLKALAEQVLAREQACEHPVNPDAKTGSRLREPVRFATPAEHWLYARLADGPKYIGALIQHWVDGRLDHVDALIDELNDARRRLGVVAVVRGNHFWWHLPEPVDRDTPRAAQQ